jgi:calcineurin-like phosphoesterase
MKKEGVLRRFLTAMPIRMETAKRDPQLHATVIGVDEATGKALSVRPYVLLGDPLD